MNSPTTNITISPAPSTLAKSFIIYVFKRKKNDLIFIGVNHKYFKKTIYGASSELNFEKSKEISVKPMN